MSVFACEKKKAFNFRSFHKNVQLKFTILSFRFDLLQSRRNVIESGVSARQREHTVSDNCKWTRFQLTLFAWNEVKFVSRSFDRVWFSLCSFLFCSCRVNKNGFYVKKKTLFYFWHNQTNCWKIKMNLINVFCVRFDSYNKRSIFVFCLFLFSSTHAIVVDLSCVLFAIQRWNNVLSFDYSLWNRFWFWFSIHENE